MLPAFIDCSLIMLFAVSVGIGVGNGLLIPTSTGLITDYFEGREANSLLGKQSAFINAGAMLLSAIGGFLCVLAWNKSYLTYAYAIPMFLIVLFCIPKDKKTGVSNTEDAPKAKLSKEVFILSAIVVIFGTFFGTLNTNNSLLVAEKEIGSTAIAGVAGSVMTACGILVGLNYGRIIGIFKNYALPLSLLSASIGMCIMGSAASAVMIYIGIAFCGIGLSLLMPTGLFRASASVSAASATFAISIFLASQNVGLFLSPIVLNPISHIFADGSAMSRYFIGAGGLMLLALYGYMHISKEQAALEQRQ